MPAADSRFRRLLEDTPLVFAGGSTIAILIGIAPSQILLGAAIAALLITRTRWRLPPVWVPLALFLAGTLISLAFSGDPAAGLPQVKKIYVYLMLAVVYTTVR